MGLYNYLIIEDACPKCLMRSRMTFQIYVASSFAGDDAGSFWERTYTIGDTLAWFPRGDKRFPQWSRGLDMRDRSVVDFCYGECPSCGVYLRVDVDVDDLRISGYRNLRVDA